MKTRTIITTLACALPLFAGATAARAQDVPLPTQIVDSLNKAFGVHPGYRANHAKGIVAEGNFKASPDAAALSKAAIFSGTALPVTVRFSNSTGIPDLPDGSDFANPHGMAIKYHLPDGSETDMVINSLHFFPVASGEEFRDLFLALAASPPTAAKPTKFDQFMAAHPAAGASFGTVATPDSFADEEYYGIDAFVLVNAAGKRQAVRYQMVPDKLVHITRADADARKPDFLMAELPERLKSGPVTFHLKAQLAAAGDPTSDPTKPWPDSNKVVDLGVLTVTNVVPDSAAAQKALLFLPGRILDGIELSDDPLVQTRDGAYAVSFSRRLQ
jgi:catalase